MFQDSRICNLTIEAPRTHFTSLNAQKQRGPGPCGDWGLDGRGQCRVSAPTASSVHDPEEWLAVFGQIMRRVLLHCLTMQREIETFALDFVGDAQADDRIEDLEDDQ